VRFPLELPIRHVVHAQDSVTGEAIADMPQEAQHRDCLAGMP
jgi:hypothetical protein